MGVLTVGQLLHKFVLDIVMLSSKRMMNDECVRSFPPQQTCDRMNFTKTSRRLIVPMQDAEHLDGWSDWWRGTLKQVIRPHVWYFVAHNCENAFSGRMKLKFELEAKQEDDSHFSAELVGMPWVYAFKLLLFGVGIMYFIHLLRLCQEKRKERRRRVVGSREHNLCISRPTVCTTSMACVNSTALWRTSIP